jgi:hypothetical protein
MGDDPLLPAPLVSEAHSSGQGAAATGGTVYHISSGLSKNGQLVVTILASLALGLSVGAVAMMAWGQSMERERARDQVAAVEKRAMDAVYMAQQTAALAREDVRVLVAELAKQNIVVSTAH